MTMQTAAASPYLFTWLVQPAIVLAGIGIFTRLILWPALKTLMRSELKADLDRLDLNDRAIRDLAARTLANEEALAALAEVPVLLAGIAANVETLMRRRN